MYDNVYHQLGSSVLLLVVEIMKLSSCPLCSGLFNFYVTLHKDVSLVQMGIYKKKNNYFCSAAISSKSNEVVYSLH